MTAFALKIIALVCMVIDHTGAVFYMDTPGYFRFIGRISFPIFSFLIAEGCSHTKDMKKYLARLGIFALISEVPFDVAFAPGGYPGSSFGGNINFLYFTNIFYTLFLGALAIYLYQIIYKKFNKTDEQRGYKPSLIENISAHAIGCLPVFPIAFAANILYTDYSAFGVLLIFLIYIVRTKKLKITVLTLGVIYKYGIWVFQLAKAVIANNFSFEYISFSHHYAYFLLFALLSVVCISFYNGKRGRSLKWAFYIIYPAHLLLLSALYYFVI